MKSKLLLICARCMYKIIKSCNKFSNLNKKFKSFLNKNKQTHILITSKIILKIQTDIKKTGKWQIAMA